MPHTCPKKAGQIAKFSLEFKLKDQVKQRMSITRRRFISHSSILAASTLGFGGYAFGLEPAWRLRVQRYAIKPPGWTNGLKLRIAALSDIHASEPYMSAVRLRQIVAKANTLEADIIVLLGDYVVGSGAHIRKLEHAEWANELARLHAPLGVFGILGNHDWWQYGNQPQKSADEIAGVLRSANIDVLQNDARRLEKSGQPFWLLGLADQLAYWDTRPRRYKGADDLPATLAKIKDDAPAILLAHEPDIFVSVPSRISLTLSGHTHGGQVRVFGWSPVTPSKYGNRFAYGHIREGNRDLLVTGGLGISRVPVRIGMPPEIMLVDLG